MSHRTDTTSFLSGLLSRILPPIPRKRSQQTSYRIRSNSTSKVGERQGCQLSSEAWPHSLFSSVFHTLRKIEEGVFVFVVMAVGSSALYIHVLHSTGNSDAQIAWNLASRRKRLVLENLVTDQRERWGRRQRERHRLKVRLKEEIASFVREEDLTRLWALDRAQMVRESYKIKDWKKNPKGFKEQPLFELYPLDFVRN